MKVTLEDLRLHPAEVSLAAQAGGVEVCDEQGEVRFRLSIPSEPIDGCEECAEMRAEIQRLRNRVLRPLTEREVEAALREGRVEAIAATSDNAWTSLLRQRDGTPDPTAERFAAMELV